VHVDQQSARLRTGKKGPVLQSRDERHSCYTPHSHLGRQTLIFELQEGIIDPSHHYPVLELQSIHIHKSTINEATIASPLVQQAVGKPALKSNAVSHMQSMTRLSVHRQKPLFA